MGWASPPAPAYRKLAGEDVRYLPVCRRGSSGGRDRTPPLLVPARTAPAPPRTTRPPAAPLARGPASHPTDQLACGGLCRGRGMLRDESVCSCVFARCPALRRRHDEKGIPAPLTCVQSPARQRSLSQSGAAPTPADQDAATLAACVDGTHAPRRGLRRSVPPFRGLRFQILHWRRVVVRIEHLQGCFRIQIRLVTFLL